MIHRILSLRITLPLVFYVANISAVVASGEKLELHSRRIAGLIDRVEAVLEVGGDLKVNESGEASSGKTTTLKMSAVANLTYDEKFIRIASDAASSARSLRHYDRAEAVIKVGDDGAKPRLRDDRRLVAVETSGPKAVLFSPRGSLTREELDLVDLLANSLVLDQLLPEGPVAVGEAWKHRPSVVASLCGIDSVQSSDVESVVKESDGETVKIDLSGRAEGTVAGLSTRVELKAKYRFDRKLGRITWLGLLLKEARAAGPMGPGLDVVAKLQMKITPVEKSDPLAAAVVTDAVWEPRAERTQLSYASLAGTWRLDHDRRWVVINDRNEDAVLRIATDDSYLAQCSIAVAKKSDAAKPPALADFQNDVRRALDKHFRQFTVASESVDESGNRIYRVVADGRVSELPIQWIYYRITAPSGRGAVFVFTLESGLAERFGKLDQQLIDGFRFTEPEAASK